jgi:hypothetical protein
MGQLHTRRRTQKKRTASFSGFRAAKGEGPDGSLGVNNVIAQRG